jgi:voltage-gated potassium channel
VQQFGMFAMRKREEHTEWLVARFEEPEQTANTDTDPVDKADKT